MLARLLVIAMLSNFSLAESHEGDPFPWWHAGNSTTVLETGCFKYSASTPAALTSGDILDERGQVPLARYHIISANTLTRYFDTFFIKRRMSVPFESEIKRELAVIAHKAKEIYGTKCRGEYCSELLEQLNRIAAKEVSFTAKGEVPLEGLFQAGRLVRALLYWLPANVFVAPRHRPDPPGDSGLDPRAPAVVRDANSLRQLRDINDAIHSYLCDDHNWSKFYIALNKLTQLAISGRSEPYPYEPALWFPDSGDAERHQNDINFSGEFSNSMNRVFRDDPFCLLPELVYSRVLKEDNLVIAATAIERVRRTAGVHWIRSNNESWIAQFGSTLAGGSFPKFLSYVGELMARRRQGSYGHIYKDNSFAVGVVGTDATFGNDSWTAQAGWNATTMGGMMYFDKLGRPAALAVSDHEAGRLQRGWLFVYANKSWLPVPSAGGLQQMFPDGAARSLDASALKFNIDDTYWLDVRRRITE